MLVLVLRIPLASVDELFSPLLLLLQLCLYLHSLLVCFLSDAGRCLLLLPSVLLLQASCEALSEILDSIQKGEEFLL